jgi:hypothetical protein
MKHLLAMIGWGLLLPVTFVAVAATPPKDYFAHRFALDLDTTAAYYTAVLPAAVYAASRNNLGDVRVFNGTNEPVPYSLDAAQPAAQAPVRQTVRWFPLPSSDTGQNGLPTGVSIAPNGALHVTLNARAPVTHASDLIDLGNPSGHLAALLIHVQNENYQGRVSVETSADLRSWQAVTQTTLLKVNYSGNTLAQERIPLDGVRARYMRLHWLDRAPAIASVEMEVQPDAKSTVAEPARAWLDGVTAQPGKTAGEYRFETQGAYPIDRLKLDLPQPNTVVRATVYSRPNQVSPWRRLTSSTLFRLENLAGEQSNPPLEITPDTDHEWRIVVDTRNGGLGNGTLVVHAGWRPATLTFIARGTPPFTLAVGNSRLTSTAISRDELLVNAASPIAQAQVGKALSAPPGQEQDTTPATPDAIRQYVLWGALLLAVALLGVMAWRLR